MLIYLTHLINKSFLKEKYIYYGKMIFFIFDFIIENKKNQI